MGKDFRIIENYLRKFSSYFRFSAGEIMEEEFYRTVHVSHRLYGKLCTY